MRQLVLAVLTTIAIVAFGFANAHEVEVSCVVGEPIEMRLVFLLAIAFAAGVVTASFRQMIVEAGRRKRARRPPVVRRPTVPQIPEDLGLDDRRA